MLSSSICAMRFSVSMYLHAAHAFDFELEYRLWVLKYYIRRSSDYILVFLVNSSTVGNTVSSSSSSSSSSFNQMSGFSHKPDKIS